MATTPRSVRASTAQSGESDASPAPSRRRAVRADAGDAAPTVKRTARESAAPAADGVAATEPARATASNGRSARSSTAKAAAKKPPAATGAPGPTGSPAKKAAPTGGSDGAPAGSPRQRVRAETLERILSIAHDRLVAGGADALSLRSVARELGMVSSAVYRYVASREDLLRLLAGRAGAQLAEAVDAAARSRRGDPARRLTTIARAVRSWALEHPGDFGLLYGRVGTTAAGAGATGEAGEPGSGALGLPAALLGLYVEGESTAAARQSPTAAARQSPAAAARQSPAVRRELANLAGALGVQAEPGATVRALLAWSTVVGAVAVEVSGQLTGVVANPGALFDVQVDQVAAATGLTG